MTRRSMMFISADCNLTFVRARVLNDRTNVEAGVGVGVNVSVCISYVSTRCRSIHEHRSYTNAVLCDARKQQQHQRGDVNTTT